VVRQLNRLVREPAVLAFFQFAVYEFTFNREKEFSQTQLAILCDVPDQQTVEEYRPIPVLCAPPGTKYIDFQVESKQQLIDLGWTEQHAIAAPQHARNVGGGTKARRQQYGLRPHVSNTLHGAMGATLSKVATEINVRGTGNQLWEKGQVVVLVSRTKYCRDLIFVGDQNATLEVICSLIQVQSQYDQYIEHVLDVLSTASHNADTNQHNRVIDEQRHFLQTNDIPLPEGGIGCCYLLISMKNYQVTYIGQTMRSLAVRLSEHNSGYGADSTREHTLRPWGLLAFVTGFDADQHSLKLFETMWEQRRLALFTQHAGEITTDEIVSVGTGLLSHVTFQYLELRMVVKGRIVSVNH
jgi:predicted GIY-YIG superfamily endonuclease